MSPARRAPVPPTVVLAGRPNVGKSTLFNRITGTRRSIVTPVPGTTRDTLEEPAAWQGIAFRLVDTGGMFGASTDPLHRLVVARGQRALEEAALVIFVVDGREGLVAGDEEIARHLRRLGRPVVLAVNKSDDRRSRHSSTEFARLGFDTMIEVAAEHGAGVAELLDEVLRSLPGGRATVAQPEPNGEERETRVAIVGRPNVGKSSLVNRLLREERVIVSEVPGTTRDAVDTLLRWHRRSFRIVDTAGIRRPGRVGQSGPLESLSVIIAKRAIARADVAVLVLDSVEGATDQDGAIAGEAERAGCGVIIAANKWDLVKDRGAPFVGTFDAGVRRRLKFLDYAPILHISALTGERASKLLEAVDLVADARRVRVPTGELNRFVETITMRHPPVADAKGEVRVLYAAQVGIEPPSFVFFTNVATRFHFSYERFLTNRLRERFGFVGSPIRLSVRRRAPRRAAAGRAGRAAT